MGKVVLITCTAPRAYEIAHNLNHDHLNAIALPCLNVRALDTPQPAGDYDALLLTSRHAVSDHLPKLPVIAIGQKTADKAQEKGMQVVQIGQGNIHDLNLSSFKNILYPAAAEPTLIPDNATYWPVYETTPNPDFMVDKENEIIAVYSVKAAALIKNHIYKHQKLVCLSDKIADIFETVHPDNVAVARQPRYDAMNELIKSM